MRVYWGATVDFFFNTNCVPTHDAKRITASRPGLSSLTNKTVGMPVPSDAGRYFHEYIVPAEQPLTVRALVVSETMINATRYREISPEKASTLVPQHGHDYEIIVRSGDGPTRILARELVQNDSGVSTKPFDISPTHSCQ